jgi:hypothetical protein
LGDLQLKWEDIPEGAKKNLEIQLEKNCQEFNMVSLTYLLRGSIFMKYQWHEKDEIREAILQSISRTFRRGKEEWSDNHFATCIFELGKSGMKWNEVPTDVQETIFKGIGEPTNSFRSLSVLLVG